MKIKVSNKYQINSKGLKDNMMSYTKQNNYKVHAH